MRLAIAIFFWVGAVFGSAASAEEQSREAFFAEWRQMLPVVARNIEFCAPQDFAYQCDIFSTFRESAHDTSQQGHFIASLFVVATINSVLAPMGEKYVSDLGCPAPAVQGNALTPVFNTEEMSFVVKSTDSSCYVEILEGSYAS